jgi:hypothetical protein
MPSIKFDCHNFLPVVLIYFYQLIKSLRLSQMVTLLIIAIKQITNATKQRSFAHMLATSLRCGGKYPSGKAREG